MLVVARRRAVARPYAARLGAELDRDVEVLGPQLRRGGVVLERCLGAQLLEHPGAEGKPARQRGGGGGVDAGDRLAADRRAVADDELGAVDVQLHDVAERRGAEAAGQRAQAEAAGDALAGGLEHVLGNPV